MVMSKPITSIIIGLGNHVLLKTKHSIGMMVCNQLALYYDISWEYKRKYKAYTASIVNPNKHVLLIKSSLPMNINGKSLSKAVKELGVPIDNIVVVHDDLDRALGKVSWKMNGSAGGHNGVKSIISSIGSNEFKRLRIGIGRPGSRSHVSDYVLQEFAQEYCNDVNVVLDKCVDMLIMEVIDVSLVESKDDESGESRGDEI